MNSRRKGADGERELAAWLRERGVEARRGCQFRGSPDSPDVATALEHVHLECKRTEALRIYDAVDQAERDAGELLPVVAFRSSRRPWLAIVPLERLLPLLARMPAAAVATPTGRPESRDATLGPG